MVADVRGPGSGVLRDEKQGARVELVQRQLTTGLRGGDATRFSIREKGATELRPRRGGKRSIGGRVHDA
jgi:hypothetical protein